MCKYGYKTENARFGMRAAIAKQVRGDAAPERFRFSVFQSGSAQGVCLSAARSAALVSRLSHIFMDSFYCCIRKLLYKYMFEYIIKV